MIGDVLTSTVLFEALREKYPEAELHYLINSHTIPVVENNPFIDKIVEFLPEIEKNKRHFLRFLKQLRREDYKVMIDVYSKPISVLMGKTTGAKTKIGYKKWYSSLVYNHLYTYKNKPETKAGLAIENRMLLLEPLDGDFPKFLKPKLYLSQDEISKAKNILKSNAIKKENPLFMIGVLGSFAKKSYPLPYLAKVLDWIVEETNADLLFNYIPKQLPEAEKLLDLCSKKTQEKIHLNIYGKSLREFFGLLSQCDALIGNEGGAINMAKALNIPTFSIFSPFIKKEAWAIFEDEKNMAVHIADYLTEDFDVSTFKKKSEDYYQQFKPELFREKLNNFLKIVSQ